MNWSTLLDPRPVKLKDGKELVTLADARAHMLKLSPEVAKQPLWQTAASELLIAAEHGGPFRFTAYCCMVRAVHGVHFKQEPNAEQRRKAKWAEKRKKARPSRS